MQLSRTRTRRHDGQGARTDFACSRGPAATISQALLIGGIGLALAFTGPSAPALSAADTVGLSARSTASSTTLPRPTLVVNVQVNPQHITSSRTGFRPGNTVFNISMSPAHGHAAVQLLRLRHGYTFNEFRADVESEELSGIRRIDRNVNFYGGMPATHAKPGQFGVRLDAGKYWLFDFDTPRWASFRVKGAPEPRALPRATGAVDMVMRHGKHRFRSRGSLPASGWLRQTNRTNEPHFMDMTHVKPSTTRRQIRRALHGQGGTGWAIKDYPGTFLISPERSVVWRYAYPPGRYLMLCFWPNADDGSTHAEMGMWNLITLR